MPNLCDSVKKLFQLKAISCDHRSCSHSAGGFSGVQIMEPQQLFERRYHVCHEQFL